MEALEAVVLPLDHRKENGAVPPEGFTEADPEAVPQAADVVLVFRIMADGSFTVKVIASVQPLASVTVTV